MYDVYTYVYECTIHIYIYSDALKCFTQWHVLKCLSAIMSGHYVNHCGISRHDDGGRSLVTRGAYQLSIRDYNSNS